MSVIAKSLVKHLIPFRYEGEFKDFQKQFYNSGKYSIVENVLTRDTKLNQYIIDKCNDRDSYCLQIEINPINDNPLYLEQNRRRQMQYTVQGNKDDQPLSFKIDDVSLFVFSKNIGFLVIDYDIRSEDYIQFTQTNYFLKQLKSKNLEEITCRRKTGKDLFEQSTANMKTFLYGLLETIGALEYQTIGEALIYAGFLLDECKDGQILKKSAAIISRGYKYSYKVSEAEIDYVVSSGFENINIGASLEGVSCIAAIGEDLTTNSFLVDNMFTQGGAFSKIYFTIYLMALNQRFSLLRVNGYIEDHFRAKRNLRFLEYIDELKSIKKIISDINVHHIHNDISQNSQYRNYFDRLRKGLNIDSLIADYDTKINGLEQIRDMLAVEREKKINRIAKLGLVVGFVAFLPSLTDVVKTIFEELGIETEGWPVMIVLAGISVLLVAGYQCAIHFAKKKS